MALVLPRPELAPCDMNGIPVLTDDALASSVGVRVAFTSRKGGISSGPYASLNLASHVDDDLSDVLENRRLLACALGANPDNVIVPNQVHGDRLVRISSSNKVALELARAASDEGADGLIVEAEDVAALLCAADCAPIIVVSPTGRFAVVHAGWRGAVAGIVGKAIRELALLNEGEGVSGAENQMNVYVGPHIHVECFEVGPEVCDRFIRTYGEGCVKDGHVDLSVAISCDAQRSGIDPARIAIAPICTKCHPGDYFSYRASNGLCGRHGAFAVRFA